MDANRYKLPKKKEPIKRSINGEERPFAAKPVQNNFNTAEKLLSNNITNEIIPDKQKNHILKSSNKPKLTVSSLFSKSKLPKPNPKSVVASDNSVSNHTYNAKRAKPKRPALFDDEDDDIFKVWQKQQELKRERKQREAAEKAAKKSLKLQKKQKRAHAKAIGAPHEFTFKIPRLKIGKPSYDFQRHKKKLIIVFAVLSIPVLFIGLGLLVGNHQPSTSEGKPKVAGEVAVKPDFTTLKPTTTENQATGIKYDTTKKVASYNDVLDGIAITVSQQPMPSKFVGDPTGEVEKLAKQINANDKISTSTLTAFAGISIKGPQTVLFAKNDLLIFIFADKKIDTLKWIDYIDSMQ